ncbi:hypothetical protein JCGZ_16039 [Jatropha curcas]|uniref:BHLH domain-containing protein n=1 Tax=Jatropha curcas TaxID=180498 RepID=A0A067KZM4_JATCU|nr:transcription factor bHLH84 [Jatropha curcas]KDP41632.1 hypothetical protein JCGZ_16039 [Jatropha curcas]
MNMESLAAFPDGEWDFSRMFSTEDQLDFTSELHFTNPSGFPLSNPEANESLFYSWNTLNPYLHFISQENSSSSNSSSTSILPSPNHQNHLFNNFPATNDISTSMDFCIMDERNPGSFLAMYPEVAMAEMGNLDENQPPGADAVSAKESQLKRKFDVSELEVNPSDSAKKKTRVTKDVQKSNRNVKSNKNRKLITPNCNPEEEINAGPDVQASSSCSSDGENASQDSNDCKTLNSNGKTRASRGSATDPQSLYARKRRERINERLRILQTLVPNGTKVDISTMLEEAVHYVKFLQLQIKLLSSDDLWMYAPIAYNGMDIGLNQKISMLL